MLVVKHFHALTRVDFVEVNSGACRREQVRLHFSRARVLLVKRRLVDDRDRLIRSAPKKSVRVHVRALLFGARLRLARGVGRPDSRFDWVFPLGAMSVGRGPAKVLGSASETLGTMPGEERRCSTHTCRETVPRPCQQRAQRARLRACSSSFAKPPRTESGLFCLFWVARGGAKTVVTSRQLCPLQICRSSLSA